MDFARGRDFSATFRTFFDIIAFQILNLCDF